MLQVPRLPSGDEVIPSIPVTAFEFLADWGQAIPIPFLSLYRPAACIQLSKRSFSLVLSPGWVLKYLSKSRSAFLTSGCFFSISLYQELCTCAYSYFSAACSFF